MKEDELGGTRSTQRRDKKSYTSRGMKSDGSRTLGSMRRKCEDNIKWILNLKIIWAC